MRGIANLIILADALDRRGLFAEANQVDGILHVALDWSGMGQWLRRKYDKMRALFQRRQQDSTAEKEYGEAAKESLDDILRRKQAGPPDERIFLWYCNRFRESCPNCIRRHGRMRTLRQWRSEGLPSSSVCQRGQCACRLVALGPGGVLTPGGIVQMTEDKDEFLGLSGLQENSLTSNMGGQGGFALEPFYSNFGQM